MARKNTIRSENSGSIHFDSRTKAVMAEVSIAQENIKEKVNAVREVILGKSNNEIILVLQYYDYDVEKTIQAYCEDGAKIALTEWHWPGNKAPNKKRKNRKKSAQKTSTEDDSPTSNGDIQDHVKENIPNGILENGSESSKLIESDTEVTLGGGAPLAPMEVLQNHSSTEGSVSSSRMVEDPGSRVVEDPGSIQQTTPSKPSQSLSQQPVSSSSSSSVQQSSSTHPQSQRQQHHHLHSRQRTHSGSHGHRQRTNSEKSSSSTTDRKHYKIHAGLEKSVKDLHRQTISLERFRLVLNEEVEKTFKRIRAVFEEMRTCINNREVDLMTEMDKVKLAANDIFAMRQKTATELKTRVDRAERLNDQELAELRADIKHFVSDRKVDEDLGRTTRFLYDSDHLKEEIANFAEVVPVKCTYTTRRPSVSSVASSGVGDDLDSLNLSQNSSKTTNQKQELPLDPQSLDPNETHEIAELQRRLKGSLQIQGFSKSTPNARNGSQGPKSSHSTGSSSTEGARRNNRRPQNRGPGKDGDSSKNSRPNSVNVSNTVPKVPSSVTVSADALSQDQGNHSNSTHDGSRPRQPNSPNRRYNDRPSSQYSGRGRGGYSRGRGSGRPRSPRKDGYNGPFRGNNPRDNRNQQGVPAPTPGTVQA